jgi:hypothetical protein
MTNSEIKKEINEAIEALKTELESKFVRNTKEPEFEDGVWYKHTMEDVFAIFTKNNENKGIIYGDWFDDIVMNNTSNWQKVTDFTELTELLKKEAVKRGMVDGALKLFKHGSVLKIKYPLRYSSNQLIDSNGLILMDKTGTWAEVVKEKTTEDWIKEAFSFSVKNHGHITELMIEFLKQNNCKITQEK